jgi:hypothetical protein
MDDPHQCDFRIGFVPTPAGDGVYYVNEGRLVSHRFADGQEIELHRDPELASAILDVSPHGSELLFGVNDPLQPGGYASAPGRRSA